MRPAIGPLGVPDLLCALESTDLEPYLQALRWILAEGETLRAVAVCYDRDTAVAGRVRKDVLSRIDAEKWATAVAITDRRILVSSANDLVREAVVDRRIALDDVRYVRARSSHGELDLITRSVDLHWVFPAAVDSTRIDALAALLAASMGVPDEEREALLRPTVRLIEAEAGAD